MKTRKFSLARIMTAALVLLLTFALAIPAFASSGSAYQEGPFNVTINPDDSTDTSMQDRFVAYQIFKGDIDDNYNPGVTESESGIFNPNKNVLINIEWGDDIDVNKFVKSLKDDTTVKLKDGSSNISIAQALQKYLPGFDTLAEDNYNTTSVARAVAKMLEAYSSNSTLVQTFAKLAKESVTGTGKTSTWKSESEQWNVELENAGYYLIVDKFRTQDSKDSEKIPSDAVSAFILGVFGNSAVNMKSTTPTPDKNIINYDSEGGGNSEGSAFEVGQKIQFELTGTLPENYAEYDTYYYAFHDTLSKGLTYLSDPAPKVTIITDDGETVLSAVAADGDVDDPGDYVVTPGKVEEGQPTTVDFVIENLKALAEKKGITIDYRSVIKVTYYAEINDESVEYGDPGNPNDLYLEFSNNPYNDSHGKSEKIEVWVYVFGLDITKISDDDDPDNPGHPKTLPDAVFEVYDGDPAGETAPSKAYFSKETDEAGVTIYTLQGWLTSDGVVPDGMTTSVVTGTDGKLNIRGLGSNTYYLKETVAPKGYNLLKNPIVVDVKTTIDESTGKMSEFTVTITNKNTDDDSDASTTSTTTYKNDGSDTYNLGIFQSGLVPMDVTNYRAPILPGTGGIGLVIFYVLGGLLLVGAATYIIVSGRKKSKQQQQ